MPTPKDCHQPCSFMLADPALQVGQLELLRLNEAPSLLFLPHAFLAVRAAAAGIPLALRQRVLLKECNQLLGLEVA